MARRTSATPARKGTDRYHHGDLRRALLQAAVRTIRSHGIDGLTLRGVGGTLGVSRTALYRHFTDKAALLAAVAAEGFRTLRQELTQAWEDGRRTLAGFEAMGTAYVRFAVAHPSHYRVMFGADIASAGHDDATKVGGDAFQVLVDALIELQAQEVARRDDPQTMALFVWAAVHGVAMLIIDGRLGREPAAIDRLTRYSNDRIRAAIAAG
jgi:AcrR family transcriptional regulator